MNREENRYLLAEAGETIAGWAEWLTQIKAKGALLSCAHLGDALLVSGQANALIALAQAQGEVSCGALVRRIDDYIAFRYVQGLLEGRVRRLGERELRGSGISNYFPRLARWQKASGSAFRSYYCGPEGGDGSSVLRLLEGLGVPDAAAYELPAASATAAFGPLQAEVLRKFNRLLNLNQVDEKAAIELRAAAVAKLVEVRRATHFSIPADSAAQLLRTFEEQARSLARTMSDEDAVHFLNDEIPPNLDVPEDEVDELLNQLSADLVVASDVSKVETDASAALSDTRRFARKAVRARGNDEEKYQRSVRRIRRSVAKLPEFRLSGAHSSALATIPSRVVQFWDPAPPPQEMVPWLESWASIGVPDGHHEVAEYERGLAVVQEVAGDLGVRAYESAKHPAVCSDLYRYAELHARGGWYVDAEHEALLPIADLIPWPVDHVFVIRPNKDRMPNGFIGAIAGSRLMREALLRACHNLLDGSSTSVVHMTGPQMFKGLVEGYMESKQASYVVLPTNVVFSGVFQQVHNQAAYKTHGHWRHADISAD